MKLLMFGWEFPPHISGGLGTACHGLTESLSKQNVDIIFVVPKLFGGEEVDRVHLINASEVRLKKSHPLISSSIERWKQSNEKVENFTRLEVESPISPYRTTESINTVVDLKSWNYELDFEKNTQELRDSDAYYSYNLSGSYGPNLLDEVERYAEIAEEIARNHEFDIIHVHDWMTIPAGIAAKRVSGKPLCVHIHSTEFDRSGENTDKQLFRIEKEGLEEADVILAVSKWTKTILINRYKIPSNRIRTVHNGILFKPKASTSALPSIGSHVVTFLGRLTYQKGPLYFVEAAQKVLQKFPDAHFIVVGSGDLFPKVIERVAELKLSSRFHFTGFLKGENVDKIWSTSSVYVMPSVSEPFGITPLEAIQAGVPVIVSNQSGVSEVMPHAIKVDFWNTDELANAICNVLAYDSLALTLQKNAQEEIKKITWDKAARKLKHIYHELSTRQQTSA
jgi:glycogen(starch) synthase